LLYEEPIPPYPSLKLLLSKLFEPIPPLNPIPLPIPPPMPEFYPKPLPKPPNPPPIPPPDPYLGTLNALRP
jgi:hypothetical protein